MAGVSHYLRMFDAAEKNSRSFMCQFCGAYTPAINSQGICHACENVISSDRAALVKNSSDACAILDNYNKQVASSDFDAALKTYDSLLAKYPAPNYTYVKALTYISYSNYELSKIRYDLPGFMEENSIHKAKASSLFSSAKLLLNKAIFDAAKQATSHPGQQATYGTSYLMFLAAAKLGDIAAAKSYLGKLKASGNTYLSTYAETVFNSHIGDFKALLSSADSILRSKDFPINVFYYISYALFKLGKRADSEKLTGALQKVLSSNTVSSLNMYSRMLK